MTINQLSATVQCHTAQPRPMRMLSTSNTTSQLTKSAARSAFHQLPLKTATPVLGVT